jgi:multiple sugar transport system substrate-binding protein
MPWGGETVMKFRQPTRRDVLRGAAATGAGLFAAANGFPVLAQDKPDIPLPEAKAGTLTVIQRSEYFQQAQDLFRDIVAKFAADKGVALDISTTNYEAFGDFVGKLTAAVKAGNPPDFAFTANASISQMTTLGLLEDVSDIVAEAESRYGNVMTGLSAQKVGMIDGKWRAIPFLSATQGYFFRNDKLAEKGIDPKGIKTWSDVREAALAVSDPANNFWGWGVTPSHSGDGYTFLIRLVQSFLGHYTDETGTKVTFNSPETVAAFEWIKETFDRNGKYAPMLPPGIESWGDTSNNEAFAAGSIAFTLNAFSVYAQAKRENNPIFPNIVLLSAPLANDGSSREQGQVGGWLTIHTNAPNQALARELALTLLDPANFNQMSSVAGGLFMPAYEGLWTPELLAADPNFATMKAIFSAPQSFIGYSWPANPNSAIDAIRAQGILEQGVATMLSGQLSPADAVAETHQLIVDLFEQGGLPQA